jgi:hypothetical protein
VLGARYAHRLEISSRPFAEVALSQGSAIRAYHNGDWNFWEIEMKHLVAAVTLCAVAIPCFSQACFDSVEYKESAATSKAANSENAAQLEKIVDSLTTAKGMTFDNALAEVMRFSTAETVAYDKALSEVSAKIRPMKPKTPDECSELIKLQTQYRAIGRDKIQFIASKFIK